jgi:trk system potassium uptake protein TrkA
MLNVVILGAGGMGQHLAEILSRTEHNVILVDHDRKKLEELSSVLDVGIRVGSGTDWQLLDDLLDLSPDFFIALTPHDEVNLTACNIAKNLGFPKAIARVRDNRFLNRSRLDFARLFSTDEFLCPELLVAWEIEKFILSSGAMEMESFFHGGAQLRTLRIPERWRGGNTPLHLLGLPADVVLGLIIRSKGDGQEVIFPHGDDVIRPGDEVTYIGETNAVAELNTFFGATRKQFRSIVMVGGSTTAINLARILHKQGLAIRIFEKDLAKCSYLAEALPHCTIIHHDGTDVDFLLSEKVNMTDLFVACTGKDDINLLAALQAKKCGVDQVIALISRPSDQALAKELGITLTVSPRLSAANRLLSWILSSRVTSCISLYDNQAEVVELQISPTSKVVGIPINELGPLLPHDFLIAVIQNRGRVIVANGNRILSPGDSVIVVTHPRHVKEFEAIF